MKTLAYIALLPSLLASVSCAAPVAGPPVASPGGTAVLLPPEVIQQKDDPLNRFVEAVTAPGLLLLVTIDGSNIRLDSATAAAVQADKIHSKPTGNAPFIRLIASAKGQTVSTVYQPDPVYVTTHDKGVEKRHQRQILLVIASAQRLDNVVVEAPATQAKASFDVKNAYKLACSMNPGGTWC